MTQENYNCFWGRQGGTISPSDPKSQLPFSCVILCSSCVIPVQDFHRFRPTPSQGARTHAGPGTRRVPGPALA